MRFKKVLGLCVIVVTTFWASITTTMQETAMYNTHHTLINIHTSNYLVTLYCRDAYSAALSAVQNLVNIDDSHFKLAMDNKQRCIRQCLTFPLLCERGIEEVKYKYKYE